MKALPVVTIAAFFIALTLGIPRLSAQVSSKRHVNVTVTDPLGRFVTGLEQGSFEVVENGVRRTITDFSNDDSPVALAIVSDEALPAIGPLRRDDELIQTPSLTNALRQLAASNNSRKVIVNLTGLDLPGIPDGIQVLQTSRADLAKAVAGLRSQYRLDFDSSTPSARFEVVLKQPVGLPALGLSWK